jgi:hypothetical protein
MNALILAVFMAQGPAAIPTVAQGPSSGIEEPRQVVVRSPAEWETLWKSHAGPQAAPAVDFSTSLVAAVFLGTRPTGGFRVEIVAARRENDALVVEYVERRPAADTLVTQILTSPFHMVSLPRFTGPIRFRRSGAGSP